MVPLGPEAWMRLRAPRTTYAILTLCWFFYPLFLDMLLTETAIFSLEISGPRVVGNFRCITGGLGSYRGPGPVLTLSSLIRPWQTSLREPLFNKHDGVSCRVVTTNWRLTILCICTYMHSWVLSTVNNKDDERAGGIWALCRFCTRPCCCWQRKRQKQSLCSSCENGQIITHAESPADYTPSSSSSVIIYLRMPPTRISMSLSQVHMRCMPLSLNPQTRNDDLFRYCVVFALTRIIFHFRYRRRLGDRLGWPWAVTFAFFLYMRYSDVPEHRNMPPSWRCGVPTVNKESGTQTKQKIRNLLSDISKFWVVLALHHKPEYFNFFYWNILEHRLLAEPHAATVRVCSIPNG